MNTKIRVDGEKLVKLVKETPKEELKKLFAKAAHESMYELCMENLKERDCDLKLTGKCKKCYDYAAKLFIPSYIDSKEPSTLGDFIFDITGDIRDGKFYNTWQGFLYGVKYVVEYGGKFHGSLGRGIEDIVNNSGISRKTWIKFLDYYFS